jgi:hypothetical protein
MDISDAAFRRTPVGQTGQPFTAGSLRAWLLQAASAAFFNAAEDKAVETAWSPSFNAITSRKTAGLFALAG